MYTPEYFTFKELVYSDTAQARNIDNIPPWESIGNLLSLCENILDPLRRAWGKPIKINSAFRCQQLNDAIKGSSPTSVHRFGKAADLWPIGYGSKFNEFASFVVKFLQDNNIGFDQVIIESNSQGQKWVHIGEYSTTGLQRGQVKNMHIA